MTRRGVVTTRGMTHGRVAKDLSELDAAWLGGLFDGEGCVLFHNRRWRREDGSYGHGTTLRIQLSNTSLPLIERVVEVVGCGSIQAKRGTTRHRVCYDWITHGENARRVLIAIEPWLIAKSDKANQAIMQFATERT